MGCQLSIMYQAELFGILEKIELTAFPVIKGKNQKGPFDIIFLEGTIVSRKDLKIVKELRKKTRVLVAIGSCATDGCVPQIKNFMKNVEKSVYNKTGHLGAIDPVPLDRHVKVDYYIRGCPVDKIEFLNFVKDVLLGKDFKTYEKPVCHECNLQENNCLLEQGKACLGPITFGDCSVMCPHLGFRCIGCRGPYTDANLNKFFIVLEEVGLTIEEAKKMMNKFAGLKISDMIEEGIKQGVVDKRYSMKTKGQ